MRIKVEIYAQKIPILYRHRVMSLIKEALFRSDKEYKEHIYNQRIKKPFCFSFSFDRKNHKTEPIKIDDKFSVEDRVFYPQDGKSSLFISSNDYRFIVTLYNGLKRLNQFKFSDDNIWHIGRVYQLKEKVFTQDHAVFKTASPIVVETKDDNPVIFSDQNFEQELNNIMNLIMQKNFSRQLIKPIKIQPITMKKEVVKHTLRGFREKTGKPVMYITANSGTFKLQADKRDLQIIYQIGLGNRTSQGFGMLEVLWWKRYTFKTGFIMQEWLAF